MIFIVILLIVRIFPIVIIRQIFIEMLVVDLIHLSTCCTVPQLLFAELSVELFEDSVDVLVKFSIDFLILARKFVLKLSIRIEFEFLIIFPN